MANNYTITTVGSGYWSSDHVQISDDFQEDKFSQPTAFPVEIPSVHSPQLNDQVPGLALPSFKSTTQPSSFVDSWPCP